MKRTIAAAVLFLFAILLIQGCGKSRPVTQGPDLPGKKVDDVKSVTFRAEGKGLAPEDAISMGQAAILAERAAVADGYRQLAEKIRGVYVDAFMESGSGAVNYDMIRTHTQTWLRGAEIISVEEVEHGITEARMRLSINFTKEGMVWWPAGITQ